MSTALLNIWVTKHNNPCEIESDRTLYVYVLKCDGKPLVWCGTKYVAMPTKCGQLEIKVPPGCYVVGAVENPDGIPPLGNHLTHIQVVRVNCGDHACVTLFNPTAHFCGHWFLTAINNHLAAGGNAVTAETARAIRNVIQPLEGLLKALPQDTFTANMIEVDEIARPKRKPTSIKPSKGGSKKGGGGTES
jgi:hypothetical protein